MSTIIHSTKKEAWIYLKKQITKLPFGYQGRLAVSHLCWTCISSTKKEKQIFI